MLRLKDKNSTDSGEVDWQTLAEGVGHGDVAAMEQLYSIFRRRLRPLFHHQLGYQDSDDMLHDVFLIVVATLRRGALRAPEALLGFAKTVASRRVAEEISKRITARKREAILDDNLPIPDRSGTPADFLATIYHSSLIQRILAELLPQQREILIRFYIEEQSRQTICAEMDLGDTQFRLLKSRSKATFGDLGRRRTRYRRKGNAETEAEGSYDGRSIT